MRRTALIAVMAVLLAGCVATPSTTPSQVPLKSDTLGFGAAPAPSVADRWWTAFGDPQLDALVDRALAGNPSLAAALARVREAQSQLSAARAATYPQISFDAQDERLRFSKDYIIPPPYAGTWQWYGTAQANLSWSLDFFGKQDAQIGRAREAARAAGLDATAARLLLAGNVAQAYISLSRAYALVDVDQEAVTQRQNILALTAGRVRAGLDTTAAQKQAEALLAVTRQELTRARASCDIAVHQIAALIGRGADAYTISRPQLRDAALALPPDLPIDLLARRADIAAAEARIASAFQGREIARKAYYPDINLLAVAGTAALGLGNLFSASALQYGAGASIHLPIFDAGTLDANYAGATAKLDEAVADYNASVVGAVRQTADAITTLRSLESQADDQRAALAAADASFALARDRYRSGLNPQQTVLDAESLVIQTRTEGATLAGDTLSARVAVLMAVGGGYAPQPDTSHAGTSP